MKIKKLSKKRCSRKVIKVMVIAGIGAFIIGALVNTSKIRSKASGIDIAEQDNENLSEVVTTTDTSDENALENYNYLDDTQTEFQEAENEGEICNNIDITHLANLNSEELVKTLEECNDEQLTEVIYSARNYIENTPVVRGDNIVTVGALKAAWLAAANIVKNSFPCTAKLITNSVCNIKYSETNGMFASKIKKDSCYKNFIKNPTSSFSFTSGDLFYALHTVNSKVSGNKVIITDVFDFKKEKAKYGDFTKMVNNWAWLCQNMGVLHPINVSITLNK